MAESVHSEENSADRIEIRDYSLPDQRPDIRFSLYNHLEFHAHSSILKAESRFFRTFLDSADKIPAEPGAEFAYEWVSEYDEDGLWHVVAKSNSNPDQNRLAGIDTLNDDDAEVFWRMLNSIYRIPFVVGPGLVIELTKFADYYRCLPAVSHNLNACFWMSPTFDLHGLDNSYSLIESAYQLRQPVLFQDCATYIAGRMPSSRRDFNGIEIQNTKIQEIVMKLRNEIFEKASLAQQTLYRVAYGYQYENFSNTRLFDLLSEVLIEISSYGLVEQPYYYRKLSEKNEQFALIFQEVLSGVLRLDTSAKAGGPFVLQSLSLQETEHRRTTMGYRRKLLVDM